MHLGRAFFLLIFISKAELQRERGRSREIAEKKGEVENLAFAGSLPGWMQWPVLGHLWFSEVDSGPCTSDHLALFSQVISRVPDPKWKNSYCSTSSQDVIGVGVLHLSCSGG